MDFLLFDDSVFLDLESPYKSLRVEDSLPDEEPYVSKDEVPEFDESIVSPR